MDRSEVRAPRWAEIIDDGTDQIRMGVTLVARVDLAPDGHVYDWCVYVAEPGSGLDVMQFSNGFAAKLDSELACSLFPRLPANLYRR